MLVGNPIVADAIGQPQVSSSSATGCPCLDADKPVSAPQQESDTAASGPYDLCSRKEPPPFTSVSFSGCGGMYSYCAGVASYLQTKFDLSCVSFYGASGGTLPAFLLAAGLNVQQFQDVCNLPGVEECKETWLGAAFNGFSIASECLLNWLPQDAFVRAKGRLHLSVTKFPTLENERLAEFSSNEDCILGMKCSSFVPWVFEFAPACKYRDSWYIDGGLTDNQPIQDSDTFCVSYNRWRKCKPHWLWPYSDPEWVQTIFDWGFEDAKRHFEGQEGA